MEADKELVDRYLQLMHAMQSGVALLMKRDPKETEPKHLRVGVNSALECNSAMLELLIDKGIVTLPEYQEKLNKYVEQDVRSYEKKLEDLMGGKVKLG